jgi:poly-gamma-glutamate synthesis protein (capsule biosynthesis protein)
MQTKLIICGVGDISFEGLSAECPSSRAFQDISPYFKNADLTIGNMESPLIKDGLPVSGKCTLHGSQDWADTLKDAGINVLSLANNHMMDYGPDGLSNTIASLKGQGIACVGAGKDIRTACLPIYLTVKGLRIAILARTAVEVSSPSYASKDRPGVAFFEIEETQKTIRTCSEGSDFVILTIHWGLEEYSFPSPKQRNLARRIIDAGADLILGHHPHVLQGVEKIKNGLAVYSLGNFLFDEFEWQYPTGDGRMKRELVEVNESNRQGGIFRATISKSDIIDYDMVPTLIHTNFYVERCDTEVRRKKLGRLSGVLKYPFYSLVWRMHALEREWSLRVKPLFKGKFSFQKISKIRFGHLKQLFQVLLRSLRISTEKTTNPYD